MFRLSKELVTQTTVRAFSQNPSVHKFKPDHEDLSWASICKLEFNFVFFAIQATSIWPFISQDSFTCPSQTTIFKSLSERPLRPLGGKAINCTHKVITLLGHNVYMFRENIRNHLDLVET